ncbi:MAG: DEAD/DEAH box helicase [Opitutaceae bacterium]|nr:DEAD/DEAH box helicase [Opitutaceae bacterium]
MPESAVLAALHPELRAWFVGRFGRLAPAQHLALPEIMAGRSVLLTAPTGSGKTLAAFLGVFDFLVRARERRELPDGIVAVYVSPLRALAYDLQKNLQQPLDELGWSWLRIGARTGDTTARERARQKRRAPHLLVTTPESLTLLLSQPAWHPAFRPVRFVIADELHALAESKRGVLFALAAERLDLLRHTGASSRTSSRATDQAKGKAPDAAPSRPDPEPGLVRLGLSATVAPLPTVAAFLVGPGRPCRIVAVTEARRARIEVFSPLRDHAYPPAGYTGSRLLAELGMYVGQKRTTLIFTNTRSGAEHIGLRLKQLMPALADRIEVHHASLDRTLRLAVEDRLKRGELRAVVCSTSLELGIDIGSIDTVVMVAAPKGVARGLQRIGRSGHSMGETSHGVLVATNCNDLAECVVTARMMARRSLEPVKISANPLDVLAQTLVGLAASASLSPDAAFAFVRRTYPYRDLARTEFDRVLHYLAGGGSALERQYGGVFGKVTTDADGCLALVAPRVARDFYQNVGTIVTESMVQVQLGRRKLGEVEESFMKGLRPGDVFVLNGRTIRLVETRLLTARVAAADSAVPTVPRWNANKMPLASGLATEVVRLRTAAAARLATGSTATLCAWLETEYTLSAANARALGGHFALQAAISVIPTADFFLVEQVTHRGLVHVFFHSLIGRSANDALSRIIARRVHELRGGNALTTIDDYGFMLTLQPFQAPTPAEWRDLFRRDGAEDALRAALETSNLVKWQFRGVAQTGLMVPRRVVGQERGARALQWSSEILFEVLRRHEPDHPLLREAYAEATLRFLDLPGALAFLGQAGSLPWEFRAPSRVSPFAFGLFVSRIRETMTLEDPETTIERLFHEMYGRDQDQSAGAGPAPTGK